MELPLKSKSAYTIVVYATHASSACCARMLYAAVKACPVFGGRLASHDANAFVDELAHEAKADPFE